MLLQAGVPLDGADNPTTMYHFAFGMVFSSPTVALVVTGVFVIVCQVKINVTNAYAGVDRLVELLLARDACPSGDGWCGWCSTCCWRCC